jgi:uncharacterized RDD family membrane protein YckC
MEQLHTYFAQLASEFFGDSTVHPIFRRALALGIDWALLMVAIFLWYYFVDPDLTNNVFHQFLLILSYFGLLNSRMGRTIGKMAMDLYVVDREGNRIGILRSMFRALPLAGLLCSPGFLILASVSATEDLLFYVIFFTGVVLLVGYVILPVFIRSRRTVADLFTGTRVISSEYQRSPFAMDVKTEWKIYLLTVLVVVTILGWRMLRSY